jgi:hypothetical protein
VLRLRVAFVLIAFMLAGASTRAAEPDAPLSALSANLLELAHRPANRVAPRGATPLFTIAKHQLRDWLDERMRDQVGPELPADLADTLNTSLSNVGHACSDPDVATCQANDFSSCCLGMLGKLRLWRFGRVTIVSTSLGVECGFDDSIYAYGWRDASWRRLLAYEKAPTDRQYSPQEIENVLISPAGARIDNDYLILTTGAGSWCSSFWLGVSYQLQRIDLSKGTGRTLLDESPLAAYVGGDVPIAAELAPREMQVTYVTSQFDERTDPFRETIRRYRVTGDRLTRIQPVASSPYLFAEEWISEPWRASRAWTKPGMRRALEPLHDQLYAIAVGHDTRFNSSDDGARCRAGTGNLWQVAFEIRERRSERTRAVYLLVREDGHHEYTLMTVRRKPRPDCMTNEEP